MATTARACARSQAADTAAALPLPAGSSCCCLAVAAALLTAPFAGAGGPTLGAVFGHLLREAITLVALLRACTRVVSPVKAQSRRCKDREETAPYLGGAHGIDDDRSPHG